MKALKKDMKQDELLRIVRTVVDEDEIADMLQRSLLCGLSYDKLEMKMNLEGKWAPCCRNHFYALRRRVLSLIQR